jgi:hypothetical protein
MLDNGYVYLAATRLSLYRSATDWAIVIEVFGFSPRAGLPDTHIYTFASRLHDRDPPEGYFTDRPTRITLPTIHPTNLALSFLSTRGRGKMPRIWSSLLEERM